MSNEECYSSIGDVLSKLDVPNADAISSVVNFEYLNINVRGRSSSPLSPHTVF